MSDERTTFLFARPSFFGGMARIFDFGQTLTEYNQSRTPDEADEIALRMDMAAVTDDLWTAVEKTVDDFQDTPRP